MAGLCQNVIVVGYRHSDNVCTQATPQFFNPRYRRWVRALFRRQDHFMLAKQVRVGGYNTLFFGSGNGMTRDKILRQLAKNTASRFNGDALHTANVGNHLIFEINVMQHLFHRLDRHCQDDEISLGSCLVNIRGDTINDAKVMAQR